MAVTAEGQAVVEQHGQVVDRVRLETAAAVLLAWQTLQKYDEAQVADFLRWVIPLVQGAQRLVAAAVDSYISRYLSAEWGTPQRPVGLDYNALSGSPLRNGVPMADVYRRPFVSVWSDLSNGVPWVDAVAKGGDRAAALATEDVTLANRAAHRDAAVEDDRIKWYRRYLRGDWSCGLCAVAATRRYSKGDLQPLHPGCDCEWEPMTSPRPGQVIDEDRLQRLKSQFGRAYSSQDTLRQFRIADDGETVLHDPRKLPDVRVVEHGERGPTLVFAEHDWTGPDEVAA